MLTYVWLYKTLSFLRDINNISECFIRLFYYNHCVFKLLLLMEYVLYGNGEHLL